MWHLYCIHDLALIGRNTTCHSRDMSVLRVSIALLYPRLGLYCIHDLASTVSTTWPLLYPRLGLYCIHDLASTVSTTWPLLYPRLGPIACQFCQYCMSVLRHVQYSCIPAICTYLYVCIHVCIYVCTSLCMFVCRYVCICRYKHMYVCTYVYIYACTHLTMKLNGVCTYVDLHDVKHYSLNTVGHDAGLETAAEQPSHTIFLNHHIDGLPLYI